MPSGYLALIVWGLLLLIAAPCEARKVAIVGAGLGGATAAYYLHKGDPSAEIHLFEKEGQVGGRFQDTTFEGVVVELGHGVFNERNGLSSQLVQELGLESTAPQGLNGTYGIFDGERLVYQEGTNDTSADDWRRFFKYFTRYTLNIRGMKFNAKAYLDDWEALLADPPFEDIPDLLNMLGMEEKATYSLAQDVSDSFGFLSLRDFGAASTRFVLGQDPPLVNSVAAHQALTVSRACRADQLWGVMGGIRRLVETLVGASKAKVHLHHHVTKIDKMAEGGYQVHYKTGGKAATDPFDVFILAAPLDSDELTLPDGVDAGPDVEWLDQEVTLVKGKINGTTFGLKPDESPPDVLATADNVYFPVHAIRRLSTFPDGEHAYLVTMAAEMTDEMVRDCFSHVSSIQRKKLEAMWPDLTAKGKGAHFPPIQLDGAQLLFPAAIESVVSGPEAIIVSARNAVRLLLEPRPQEEPLSGSIEESAAAVEESTERVDVGTVPKHVLGSTTGVETAELKGAEAADRTEL